MLCLKCRTELEQTHTVTCPAGKTQRYVCPKRGCGLTFLGVTLILQEIGDKGTGMHAMMKKMKAGKVQVRVAN